MKRFLKIGFLFMIFMGLFYASALFLWKDIMPKKFTKNINYRIGSYGHMYTRIREIPHFKDVDLLFLGSSHAYRGFDVREFSKVGLSSFNLGSSAQTPIQTQILLKRYLQVLRPKLVVYEVYPGTFCSDGVEASVDLIANDQNDWHSFFMTVKSANVKVFNTFIYAITRDLFDLNKYFKEPKNRKKDRYISGGFVEQQLSYYQPGPEKTKKWNFNPKQIKVFKEVAQLLESQGVPVIFVKAPITNNLYNAYINNDSFDRLMTPFGNYYNFNELLPLNDSIYFYDGHHLNQNGVFKFNEEVIQVIHDYMRQHREVVRN